MKEQYDLKAVPCLFYVQVLASAQFFSPALLCHINLPKKYHTHALSPGSDPGSPLVPVLALSAEGICNTF